MARIVSSPWKLTSKGVSCRSCDPYEAQRNNRVFTALVNSSGHNGPLALVADGVLVDLSLWGTSIMALRWRARTGHTSARSRLRAPEPVCDHVLDFLKRYHGRKLSEVMDAEIDISDSDSILRWRSSFNAPALSVAAIWESWSPCRRSTDGA